jgi:AcrR family transcriptional regulator
VKKSRTVTQATRTTIAKIMREVGLTVGGFYNHFDSRENLVAEALSFAFKSWRRCWSQSDSGVPSTYARLVDDYLSPIHCHDLGSGCVMSALAAQERYSSGFVAHHYFSASFMDKSAPGNRTGEERQQPARQGRVIRNFLQWAAAAPPALVLVQSQIITDPIKRITPSTRKHSLYAMTNEFV